MKIFIKNRYSVFCFIFWYQVVTIIGQPIDSIKEKFTSVERISSTSVKNQNKSITCWSFAVLSMLESELMQSGKGEVDLSEMYIVRQTYIEKAQRYVRMHGSINFGGGGALNDPLDVIKKYGILPTSAYSGLKDGYTKINNFEMDAVLKNYVSELVKNKKLSDSWKVSFDNLLDKYLGKIPEKFNYGGKEYTPLSFAAMLNINSDNYLMFTSFTHHPYYQKFILEVPDNWSWGESYNLPLDEFQRIIDYSLDKGYSVAIACDMTEKGFFWKEGIALAPDHVENGNSRSNAAGKCVPSRDTLKFTTDEVTITSQLRQESFDNYETTDDHDFHIIGIAKDQNGKKFYLAKNSWGTENNKYKGYMYLSESYIKFKALNVLVNKKGVPCDILKKIGL